MSRNLLLLFHTASLPEGIEKSRLPSAFNGCYEITLPGETPDFRFLLNLRGGDPARATFSAKKSPGMSDFIPVIVAGENSPLVTEAQKQNVRLIILAKDADMGSLQTSVAQMKASMQHPARVQTAAPALAK